MRKRGLLKYSMISLLRNNRISTGSQIHPVEADDVIRAVHAVPQFNLSKVKII